MRVFFVDDSGKRKGGWFCLSAASVDGNDLLLLDSTITQVKRSFGIPKGVEVKMSHVALEHNNPLKDWGLGFPERKALARKMLEEASKIPSFRTICVGVHEPSLRPPRRDALDWACKFLFERCQFLVEKEGDAAALMFFDTEPQRAKDIAQIMSEGSYYAQFSAFSEPVAFQRSGASHGLQIVDFVAGAAYRYWDRGHDEYLSIIWPTLYRQYDDPRGSGMKSLPGRYPTGQYP